MKKILLLLLATVLALALFGCDKKGSDDPGTLDQTGNVNQPGNITQIFTPLSGRYYAEHTTDDPDELLKIPYVELDMDKKTFIMSPGKSSSYAEHGSIAVVDGIMTLAGQDGSFTFEIHNEKNIMVADNGNHPNIKVNNYVVFTYDEIENEK